MKLRWRTSSEMDEEIQAHIAKSRPISIAA